MKDILKLIGIVIIFPFAMALLGAFVMLISWPMLWTLAKVAQILPNPFM
jgi:hypothetical protein